MKKLIFYNNFHNNIGYFFIKKINKEHFLNNSKILQIIKMSKNVYLNIF